ncbi:ISAzo13-like element transposase-related protein [Hyella patelloides]|uniref:ISAzo13-like element transposase-related protein n=1 Tax=Hyella patelloides TaxID=1982969 RepID=UPI00319E5BA6
MPETETIFENLAQANKKADKNQKVVRISIDSKARVKIGNLSRGGKSRTREALKANDHDHNWSETLVPFGIFDLKSEQLSIYWGTSAETSDFMVDCLSMWWENNQGSYSELEELVINLDNGISHRSNRTQFIKRICQFSSENKLRIRLIYYPPYRAQI